MALQRSKLQVNIHIYILTYIQIKKFNQTSLQIDSLIVVALDTRRARLICSIVEFFLTKSTKERDY